MKRVASRDINGNSPGTADLQPASDATYDLGSATKRYKAVYSLDMIAESFSIPGGTSSQYLRADGSTGSGPANTTLDSAEPGAYSLVSNGIGPDLSVKRVIPGNNMKFIDGPFSLTIASDPYAAPAVSATTWPYYTLAAPVDPPPSGNLSFDNNDPTLATEIRINTTTWNDDPLKAVDVTQMMSFITLSNAIYLQESNNSANFITFNVTGQPVINAGAIKAPIALLNSGGTGVTGFPDLSYVIVVVLIDTPELTTRVADLESVTQNMSGFSGLTTFANDIRFDRITDAVGGELISTDVAEVAVNGSASFLYGGVQVATLNSVSLTNAGGTSLVNDGIGPSLATKGLSAGTGGISLAGALTTVTIDNTLTGQNMGSGNGTVFKQKALDVLQFHTLTGTNNGLTVSAPSGNQITFDNTLTGLNLGAGTGTIFDSKNGANLRFNSLIAGPGMTVSAPSGNQITITNTSLNTAVAITNAGGTQTLIATATAPTFTLKGLSVGGGGLVLTSNATSVTHALAAGVQFSHFAGDQAVTVANTVTETPLYGAGNGSLTWTSTSDSSSKLFELHGVISSLVGAVINFKLKRGGVNCIDFSTTLPALTNAPWHFTVTTTYIAGSFSSNAKFTYLAAGGAVTNMSFFSQPAAAGSNTWGISSTWGAASASNSITQHSCSAANLWV